MYEMWPLRCVLVNMIQAYYTRNPVALDFFLQVAAASCWERMVEGSCKHGRGRCTSLPVTAVMLLSPWLKS